MTQLGCTDSSASSSRIYKLAWNDGTAMTIIGADGALFEHPVTQAFVTLAPAQRADILLDLSARELGTSVQLQSATFDTTDISRGGFGMMSGMGGMHGASRDAPAGILPNGAALHLLTIYVAHRTSAPFRMPTTVAAPDTDWVDESTPVKRRLAITLHAGQWLLGGRRFSMTDVAPDEIVRAGSTQIWEVTNAGGMMGEQMTHPLHVHGTQFNVLLRRHADNAAASRSIREGLIDTGWRDTVLILPRETVRLQLRFTHFPGLYLYHCHNLEHEDMGMKRNLRVIG